MFSLIVAYAVIKIFSTPNSAKTTILYRGENILYPGGMKNIPSDAQHYELRYVA